MYELPCKGCNCIIRYKCKSYHRYIKNDYTPRTWFILPSYDKITKTCINFIEDTNYYNYKNSIKIELLNTLNMSKLKNFHIIITSTKTSVCSGSYDACLNMFNLQDKAYHKTHKIISDEEYNKITKKKQVL